MYRSLGVSLPLYVTMFMPVPLFVSALFSVSASFILFPLFSFCDTTPASIKMYEDAVNLAGDNVF